MELNAISTRILSKPNAAISPNNTPSPTPEYSARQGEKHNPTVATKNGGDSSARGVLTPETALEILTAQPQSEDLLRVLRWLDHCSSSSSSSPLSSSSLPASSSISTISTKNISTSTGTGTSDESTSTPTVNDASNINVGINIKIPGPKALQLIHTLVNDIIPHHWPLATAPVSSSTAAANDEDDDDDDAQEAQTTTTTMTKKLRSLLVRNLRSVAAVGALVARVRALNSGASLESGGLGGLRSGGRGEGIGALTTTMEVLEAVLQGEGFLSGIWATAGGGLGEAKEEEVVKVRGLGWKEGVGLLAGGKVLSAAGEAERVLGEGSEGVRGERSWVADGERYAGWLGRNVWLIVVHAAGDGVEESRAAGQILAKGLKLGHVDAMVRAIFADVISGNEESVRKSLGLLDCLTVHEQRMVLYAIIRALEKRHLSLDGGAYVKTNRGLLGSVAALLSAIIADSPTRKDTILEWLTGLSAEAARQGHLTHRAVVLALSADSASVKTALSRALELFADKLFIKHTPIFQQEINAQILLLLIGYVHRADKVILEKTSKSSLYLNAISNHLASTSPRSRFLGMVVGTAMSDLVDTKDKRMNFSSDDMEGADGRWYRALTGVKDQLRPVRDLLSITDSKKQSAPQRLSTTSSVDKRPKSVSPMKGSSKITSIEELPDNLSEDDDLPTYAKPHSDPEDSDEDPELVQRNKATAPVYIRDLLAGLRDLDNYDRHCLALSTASSLIRRKTSFGTEVTDNIEDLATVLVGLNDKYEMESFQHHRLQGMIALLIANPETMGPWYARAFYNGEYSMSQRASVLTTLGLGAREIAGLGKEDEAMTGSSLSVESQFPSKRLPEKLHNHYASLPSPSRFALKPPSPKATSTPFDALSINLSKKMLQPLAAKAADELTGPSALKVRTFSSRLAVQSRTAPPTANPLAKILASAFFFPLIGRWSIHLQSSSSSSNNPTTSPFLLSHLLRTLALILHAGGPTSGSGGGAGTSSWRDISSEFWSLLLSVRARATLSGELPLLEALLFAFLTLLDVNLAQGGGARRVAEEQAPELLETLAWVEGLFERIGARGRGGSEEDERVGMLAAGVMGRCREVVDGYRRLLMGEMVGFG